MKLLDTTVAVDFLRGHPPAVALLTDLARADDLAASELVRFELLTGARPAELASLEDFFSVLAWIPVESRVASRGAELARRYRSSHSGIDDVDYLIAATALVFDLDLVTTNVRHFPMLPDLTPEY